MADRRLNPEHTSDIRLRAEINEYAMVVIDEAHNLRNPGTQRAHALAPAIGRFAAQEAGNAHCHPGE